MEVRLVFNVSYDVRLTSVLITTIVYFELILLNRLTLLFTLLRLNTLLLSLPLQVKICQTSVQVL